MKPADLQPGHRIPLIRPSYAPWRTERLVVASNPEDEYDPERDRLLVGVDVDVEAPGNTIGHGELLVRVNADVARVACPSGSPLQYRLSFHPDTDVEVE